MRRNLEMTRSKWEFVCAGRINKIINKANSEGEKGQKGALQDESGVSKR